jgi:hypothetical protein
MRGIIAAILGLAVLSVGCGGKSTPTAPTPTVQSVTVTSATDLVFIGASESFTANVVMSDGSSRAASGGTWGTDAPAVVAVEGGSGRVTGLASGTATIYFDVQGSRGTKLIRVLPNYQGTWSGSYVVRGCTHTGDLSRGNFCGNFPENRVFPTNLNITQDRDRVQGRFFLGTLGGDGSGPVQSDGRLLFTGAIHEAVATIEVACALESATAGRVTGTLALLWRATGLSGDARVNADIRDLNRVSTISVPAQLAPAHAPGTLADVLRMLEGRR